MFKHHENPLTSLGIGQTVSIVKWLEEMNIPVNRYEINKDLTININGDLYLWNKNINKFPDYIKFNIIYGNFACDRNQLISLKGCPYIVEGNFYCTMNKLTSLEGCPKIVKGIFNCRKNEVKFVKKVVKKLCKVKKDIYV